MLGQVDEKGRRRHVAEDVSNRTIDLSEHTRRIRKKKKGDSALGAKWKKPKEEPKRKSGCS